MQSLQISCQKIDLMGIQKSFDDIRRLQVPYCFDVIVNGRSIVSFIIQMVTILPEKKFKIIALIKGKLLSSLKLRNFQNPFNKD